MKERKYSFRADPDNEAILEDLKKNGFNISSEINKALRESFIKRCPLCGEVKSEECVVVSDNSCHRYIIPFNKLGDWNKFMELDDDNPSSWDVPKYAKRIDGGRIVFEKYRIE